MENSLADRRELYLYDQRHSSSLVVDSTQLNEHIKMIKTMVGTAKSEPFCYCFFIHFYYSLFSERFFILVVDVKTFLSQCELRLSSQSANVQYWTCDSFKVSPMISIDVLSHLLSPIMNEHGNSSSTTIDPAYHRIKLLLTSFFQKIPMKDKSKLSSIRITNGSQRQQFKRPTVNRRM